MTQAEWINWTGGRCPLQPDLRIDVEFRNGSIYHHTSPLDWDWQHSGHDDDIIAYRISQEASKISATKDIPWQAGQEYRTRSNQRARIYATDGADPFPIHGALQVDQDWVHFVWRANGQIRGSSMSMDDLMPIDTAYASSPLPTVSGRTAYEWMQLAIQMQMQVRDAYMAGLKKGWTDYQTIHILDIDDLYAKWAEQNLIRW